MHTDKNWHIFLQSKYYFKHGNTTGQWSQPSPVIVPLQTFPNGLRFSSSSFLNKTWPGHSVFACILLGFWTRDGQMMLKIGSRALLDFNRYGLDKTAFGGRIFFVVLLVNTYLFIIFIYLTSPNLTINKTMNASLLVIKILIIYLSSYY